MEKESSNQNAQVRDRLIAMNESAELGGGKARIEAQHKKGKKTARERIAALLDNGSFAEIDKFVLSRQEESGKPGEKYYGDGVVTGYGTIDG
ncbi:MAG TPA: carboxyl transferase domain-containing protein, partial [Nitrososphaerales archaeon]|nr:carboxyl transferase domain-containing protein [Nitrososphaerales archaeon]